MTFLVGMIAFCVDIGRVLLAKSELQNACDAAALAAGQSLGGTYVTQNVVYRGKTQAQIVTAAKSAANTPNDGRVPARGVNPQPIRAEVRATQRATADSRVGTVSLRV